MAGSDASGSMEATGTSGAGAQPSLRELAIFGALAVAPTITDAAITLHLSQSQLSRILRGLERRLGVVLFDRTTAGLRLTAEGREFARTAETIQVAYAREMQTFRSRIAGESGDLRIAVLPSVAYEHMAEWTNRFRERAPHATVTATDEISGSGISAVAAGEADLAISAARMRLPDGREQSLFGEARGVRLLPLLTERFHLVAPPDAELPEGPSWEFALARLTVGFTEIAGVQRSLVRIAHAEGLLYGPETLTNSPLTIAGLVEAGLGWSVVPTSNLRLMEVRDLRTAELPGYERVVCIVVPVDDSTPLAQHFVDALLEG